MLWHEWLPASVFERIAAFVEWAGVSLTTSTAGNWAELSANNLLSLLAIVAVTTLYSTTGGLRAVVNTDLLQFSIAMLATLIYAVVVVRAVGGLGALPDRLVELYGAVQTRELLAFTPTRARDASWLVIGTIAIQWIAQMNADGTGYLAQRTMACRTERDSRQASVVFVVAQILLRSLLWIPIGLGLLVLMPVDGATEAANVAAREVTFVDGIVRYLPSGARGLMVAGMLAALASTIDTHLNWGASYWANDLYKRLLCQAWRQREPSGRSLVIVARLSNLLILALAIVILTQLGSIQSAWQTSLLLGAGMGTPLVLRWIWWRVTAAAELGAIVTSTVAAPLLLVIVDSEGGRMLMMAAISTLVVVGITLFSRGEARESLVIFYRRVRPPGFWGPVARELGESEQEVQRRLWRGIVATGIGALTVFSALVAAGSWLYGSPPPTWLPSRAAWIALLLASAGVLAWLLTRLITDPTAPIRRTQDPVEPDA